MIRDTLTSPRSPALLYWMRRPVRRCGRFSFKKYRRYKNMNNTKFITDIEDRLSDAKFDEKVINYVIGKIKQSFRNGVSVGKRKKINPDAL